MVRNTRKMPVFGVGPIYVISCFILTCMALKFKESGVLDSGNISTLKIPMLIIGSLLIIVGIIMWIWAVFIQKITNEVKKGELITTGVYSLVRNPIYSAFLHIFTGVLIIGHNFYLMILPIVFYFYLSILMKYTEEKWLVEKFGTEYIQYCKRVNRIIPLDLQYKNSSGGINVKY